ncbi:ATP-binding protein [Paenibacillus aurantius]|uniref:histidine kinase n=1 Tax=Paenibacillus aurantius TaxID=2918900 RepID=A0AA96LB19_9BACL|nr:ATP-binding protein [Paenibacillus aurantius]WNQ09918.1 ATP-binding protein [Paenibacillus aurantius]
MEKFRVRLTLLFVALIGMSVLVAGLFTGQLLKRSYIDALQTNMEREIAVILASGEWTRTGSIPDLMKVYSDKVHYYKEAAGARITYIAADGTVLGDSDHDPATMDNHLGREEIQDAAQGTIGFSTRHSDTIGQNMLYAAKAVKQNGQTIAYIRLAMSLEQVEESIDKLWRFLLFGLAILFLIAVMVSFRIAYNLTRPLETIAQVAQQITNRNYKYRVSASRRNEVGRLGEAINTMADSLEVQMKQISENERRLKNVLDNMMSGVLMIDRSHTIVLLNRAAEDLLGFTSEELLGKPYEAANRQVEFSQMIRECMETREYVRDEVVFYYPEERILEINLNPLYGANGEWSGVLIVLHNITAVRRLERMRSEFVANVSHELKTPVTAVKGFAETLLAGAMNDPETAKSFLQIIYEESDRLNRLIGDILELSKIESKRIPLHFSPVELKEFIEKTVHVMKAQADKKKITLELEAGEDLYLEADEDRLRQIVINLLSNGIAYTPEGGKVKVSVEPLVAASGEEEKIRLTISDTGMGIPKKDLPRIFERFYRVDKARSRSSGGTGLGLSIVKHLVELHHGTIAVESEVGLGSRFIIEIPVLHP